jgi:hypothetical protein
VVGEVGGVAGVEGAVAAAVQDRGGGGHLWQDVAEVGFQEALDDLDGATDAGAHAEDALVLAACLARAGSVAEALAGLVACHHPRASWIRAQTHRRDKTRGPAAAPARPPPAGLRGAHLPVQLPTASGQPLTVQRWNVSGA